MLNQAARDVLANLPRVDGNDYVIVGDKEGGPLIGLQRPWDRLRKEAGLGDVRVHDLRHSFASFGATLASATEGSWRSAVSSWLR